MDYDKEMFLYYVELVIGELTKRKISYNIKLANEIFAFCYHGVNTTLFIPYPEHNDRYLKQCYYNLQEKYDRGIISEYEWAKIEEEVKKWNIIIQQYIHLKMDMEQHK